MTKNDTSTYPRDVAGEPADPPVDAPDDLVQAWRDFEEGERELLEDAPLFGAGEWRLAPALEVLLEEADTVNPRRDRRSDGTVGDARHAARSSRHNPDARGVVNAADVDKDGLPMAAAVEAARQAVLAGKLPQLVGGAIIYAARITSPDFEEWLEYEGDNPHVTHAHFELGPDRRRQDDRRAWGIWTPDRPAAPRTGPTTPRDAPPRPTSDLRGRSLTLRGEEGNQGPRVAALQSFLRRVHRGVYAELDVDGAWGPKTSAVLRSWSQRVGVRSADGRNIGPQLARKLLLGGFRG